MKPYQLNERVYEVEAQLHVCLHGEAVLHNYDDSCFACSRVEGGEGGESRHAELCRSIKKLTLRDGSYVGPRGLKHVHQGELPPHAEQPASVPCHREGRKILSTILARCSLPAGRWPSPAGRWPYNARRWLPPCGLLASPAGPGARLARGRALIPEEFFSNFQQLHSLILTYMPQLLVCCLLLKLPLGALRLRLRLTLRLLLTLNNVCRRSRRLLCLLEFQPQRELYHLPLVRPAL
jgi:hypothetical protein